jgi:hypothetical protein
LQHIRERAFLSSKPPSWLKNEAAHTQFDAKPREGREERLSLHSSGLFAIYSKVLMRFLDALSLIFQAKEVIEEEAEFNAKFVVRMIPRLNWAALCNALATVRFIYIVRCYF